MARKKALVAFEIYISGGILFIAACRASREARIDSSSLYTGTITLANEQVTEEYIEVRGWAKQYPNPTPQGEAEMSDRTHDLSLSLSKCN
jgi:hypothetical protein